MPSFGALWGVMWNKSVSSEYLLKFKEEHSFERKKLVFIILTVRRSERKAAALYQGIPSSPLKCQRSQKWGVRGGSWRECDVAMVGIPKPTWAKYGLNQAETSMLYAPWNHRVFYPLIKLMKLSRADCLPFSVQCSQAPLCMGFSRGEYWSGLPFPSPGHLPNPGIEPGSPALHADSSPSKSPGKPIMKPMRVLLLFFLRKYYFFKNSEGIKNSHD